jgi:hypothetical protein
MNLAVPAPGTDAGVAQGARRPGGLGAGDGSLLMARLALPGVGVTAGDRRIVRVRGLTAPFRARPGHAPPVDDTARPVPRPGRRRPGHPFGTAPTELPLAGHRPTRSPTDGSSIDTIGRTPAAAGSADAGEEVDGGGGPA